MKGLSRNSFGAQPTILFFPAAELAGLLWLYMNPGISFTGMAAVLLGVCLSLCFSVHITFHEAVHQQFFKHPVTDFFVGCVMTLLMGLPFEGYRWHHINHHRHNNFLDDYSTTWKRTTAGIVPQTWWEYILGWPVQLWRSKKMMDQEEQQGKLPARVLRHLFWQKSLLTLVWVSLAWFSWPFAGLYLISIYGGWALVALENFAQHPPIKYGVDTTMSYYDAFYNFLFFKNGLHVEHHRAAGVPWFNLTPEPSVHTITRPYLLEPLLPKVKVPSAER